MFTKNDLVRRAEYIRKENFKKTYKFLLDKMWAAANEGEYSIIFKITDLTSEFINWLFGEGYEIRIPIPGYVNAWKIIDKFNFEEEVFTKEIKVSW